MTEILRLILGFVIWSGAFLLIYAAQATGCALGTDPARLRLILGGLLALSAAAGAAALVQAGRRGSPLGRSARWAQAAALGATLLVFSGVLWMSPC